MEFVGSAMDILKSVWTFLAHQLGYVKDLKKNFENLNERARELYMWREDVNLQISRDTVEKMPTHDCTIWLEKVEEIENQMNEITNEYKENKRCMIGWCPNVSSHRKLGKHVVKTIDRIKEIHKYDGSVVVDVPRQIVDIIPAPEIETKTSTDRTVQKIMKFIKDEKIGKIGVWGMGGIGKTTVMKILNNQPEICKIFAIVIWVTVSKDWNLRKVQKEIGERLHLSIGDDESDDQVRRKLFLKLERQKYLLLLDDMWYKIDLDKVGVPYPNQQNGCKIVLTTRLLKVCKTMETDEDIKVEVLSEEEAWKLFHKKAGDIVTSLEIQPLARDVVKECGGLPLAIIVVGASLRNEEIVPVWRNALRELKSPSTAIFDMEEMEEEVYKPLKFSYDRLRDDNVKKCFLYAALYPEDHAINKFELIDYWRGEGLLYDIKSLIEARDKGLTILKSLLDASLFEIDHRDDGGYIKMHDVIRDLALRITSPLKQESYRFLVKAGVKLAKPPEDKEWEQAERISLVYNDLESLPERPNCPTLLTLLLRSNRRLGSIPESFFMHMTSLQVLDLSDTKIDSLPKSICKLVSLRALYLNKELRRLSPHVVKLARIETLHLHSFTSLPVEIEKLTRLRSLKVGFDIFLEAEENQKQQLSILSSLCLLEELILTYPNLGTVSCQYSRVEGLVEAVCRLKELTSLQFWFPTMDCLQYFLKNSQSWIDGRLMSFKFYAQNKRLLGSMAGYWNEYRHLTFSGGDSIPQPLEIKQILNRVNDFNLQGHSTVRKLCDFGVENIKCLKRCEVRKCNEMVAILEDGIDALPSLEVLYLRDLPMLKSLWKGSVPPRSLVTLRVYKCPKLKRLPLGIHNSTNLRKIEGAKKWWNALEWEDDAIKQKLQPLFSPWK